MDKARIIARVGKIPVLADALRWLLEHAGLAAGDVRQLVADRGLEGALGVLRDAGVYVSYEEYLGKQPARRGSATFDFSPPEFFNPVTEADFMGSTGGSRSSGTPVEMSFTYERRQAVLRSLQYQEFGLIGAPGAIWLPVFPSSAGFGAVLKAMARVREAAPRDLLLLARLSALDPDLVAAARGAVAGGAAATGVVVAAGAGTGAGVAVTGGEAAGGAGWMPPPAAGAGEGLATLGGVTATSAIGRVSTAPGSSAGVVAAPALPDRDSCSRCPG